MASPLKTLFHTLCTGWLIEYPGRDIDGPSDFFANADPARTHPMTKKILRRQKLEREQREKEKLWDSDEDDTDVTEEVWDLKKSERNLVDKEWILMEGTT